MPSKNLAALAAAGAAVLIAGCGSSGGHAAAPASSAPVTAAAATPSASAFTPTTAQETYLTDLAAALAKVGEQSTASDQQTVTTGETICTALGNGTAPSAIISGVSNPADGKIIVGTAEKDLCPQYLPRVLLKLSGSGIQNSAPFAVSSSMLTVTYTYNCADDGGTGNFIADITDGSDDQTVANALGAGGTTTTTVYPTDQGSDYHLAVNSECTWTVTVSSG